MKIVQNWGAYILKYDPNVKQSRGIERTQRAFATAMFDSLAQKPFDKITVNGLCQKADYPRATFYNYFDDKFDLLNFCWFKLGQDTHLDVSDTQKGKLTIKETFAQIYKLFKDQQSLLLSIIENNPIDSPLVNHFVRHFTDVIYASVKKNVDAQNTHTPSELVAQHCSTTIIEILRWIYLGQHKVTLDEAETYLTELLSGPIHLQ